MSESGVDWAEYAFSFVCGCIHNCSYPCWAMKYALRYGWIKHPSEWVKPRLFKTNEQRLRRLLKKPPGRVFFQEYGDAYQRVPWIQEKARHYLRRLLSSRHTILILTKSPDVRKDYDLISRYENVEVGFTITSLERNPYESKAPHPKERINALIEAKEEYNIKTFVSWEPWIPGYDPIEGVRELAEYVDFWIFGSLNINRKPRFPHYYRRELPKLLRFLQARKIKYMIKEELASCLTKCPGDYVRQLDTRVK